MFTVLECVAVQHDHAIVLLAAVICLLGMHAFFHLLLRAEESPAGRKPYWVLVAAFAAGLSVWATHFVAMLAYKGSVPIGFDFQFTALSAVLAVLGFWLALRARSQASYSPVIVGTLVTLSVAVMHFVGMAGMDVAATISYRWGPVLGGFAVAWVFFLLAFFLFLRFAAWKRIVIPAGCSILAICALHFTAMSATILSPDPSVAGPDPDNLARVIMIAAVSGVTFLVLAATATAALVDRYLVDLKGLVDATLDGLAVVRDGRIVELNTRFAGLVGSDEASLMGKNPDDLFKAMDGQPTYLPRLAPVEAIRERTDRPQVFELAVRTIEYRGHPCEVLAIRDLTEKREAQREIEYLARHDVLTGLSNRTMFQTRLHQQIEHCDAEDEFALLALDLDRFKAVNDIFGHAEGDRVLKKVATILDECARPGDIVARLGGDEFVILTARHTKSEEARLLAETILAMFGLKMNAANDPTAVGVSIGIAVFPRDGNSNESILHAADLALYRAKMGGRGILSFYDPLMDQEARERRQLETDLRLAINRNELVLNYQPVLSVECGQVVGYEALVRWQHPTRGVVPPDVFIPIAEESGIIISLGEWVLREACRQASTWAPHLKIAVNVSPLQFSLANLGHVVCTVLMQSGLSPNRLELEITEAALLKDRKATLIILNQLKALGVAIVMDDFGTGYSSLSNLQSFPFDKIKIDRSFIAAMSEDDNARAIVRAVIGLGRSLDLPVTAEGIETDAQYRMVVDEGCAQAQGYLFGRPDVAPAAAASTGKRKKHSV
ncbi:EAL domain-containing protein [Agrobacterium tumefaciens]|uniref:bifunctional diguanylate cyclase/phosphodiesterase n=1 Tax=Agrobacterium tumefaciens TaxID=358 RepID=UPI000E0F01BF|nr:EAL domain-containing protein [Agrobacterium tumefaciens]NSY45927.1 EAL domain-containing protein [Agrobacterium tumefaciens]WCK68291.1 EAL domain-containing protein [Agrobacterium tumefaciens]